VGHQLFLIVYEGPQVVPRNFQVYINHRKEMKYKRTFVFFIELNNYVKTTCSTLCWHTAFIFY
jgi:hypothetical protein